MSFALPEANAGEATPYALIGQARARPEQVEALARRLLSLVASTREEAGCLQYHVHQDRADPALFHFYEAWSSREHLLRHLEQPYIAQFLAEREHYLAEEMQTRWLVMLSANPA
nr:putative quinol monooxygenase [Chromobacterium sp. ASV5]